jgi:hypothetical protein
MQNSRCQEPPQDVCGGRKASISIRPYFYHWIKWSLYGCAAAGMCNFNAYFSKLGVQSQHYGRWWMCGKSHGKVSENLYLGWTKPTFLEEVAQHPPHVMMWAEVTCLLINGPPFFDVSVTGESYLKLCPTS